MVARHDPTVALAAVQIDRPGSIIHRLNTDANNLHIQVLDSALSCALELTHTANWSFYYHQTISIIVNSKNVCGGSSEFLYGIRCCSSED